MRSLLAEIRLVLKLFLHDAARQRKRTALTVAAVAWGTLSIVMLLSFGEGLKRSVSKGARGLGDGIGILWAGSTSRPWQGLPSGRVIPLREQDRDIIAARVPEIDAISVEYVRYAPMVNGAKTVNGRVRGVDECFGEMRKLAPREGGRFINARDIAEKRRVVFLGDELARDLYGTEEGLVGRFVEINRSKFLIVGVAQYKQQMSSYGSPDKTQATIPSTTHKALFPDANVENIVYRARTPQLAEAAKTNLYRVMGQARRFDPTDERAISLWDTREMQEINAKIGIGIQIFLGVIGGLTLLVGGMGVANVMFAVLRERTREIGVKMALGAKTRQIMVPFVLEGLLITCLGGLVGITLSLGLIGIISVLPLEGEAFEIIGQPTFSPGVAIATASVLGMIGMLAGLIPARRAATVDPAVSLRYE